eukprot:764181-Prorocentrum_minimum.AAC.2
MDSTFCRWKEVCGTKQKDYLNSLNQEQRDAVTAKIGPVRVLAGPGSGKTRVLTCRVAHLIAHEGVSPSDILCLTFTNKAANEMKGRLSTLLPNGAHEYLTVSAPKIVTQPCLHHHFISKPTTDTALNSP